MPSEFENGDDRFGDAPGPEKIFGDVERAAMERFDLYDGDGFDERAAFAEALDAMALITKDLADKSSGLNIYLETLRSEAIQAMQAMALTDPREYPGDIATRQATVARYLHLVEWLKEAIDAATEAQEVMTEEAVSG